MSDSADLEPDAGMLPFPETEQSRDSSLSLSASANVNHTELESESVSKDEIKARIQRNKEAAQKRLQETIKRKQLEAGPTPSSASSSPSPLHHHPPQPKRPKTQEEIALEQIIAQGQVVRVHGYKLVDTGGGFLLEEKDLLPNEDDESSAPLKIVTESPPIIPSDCPNCEACGKQFSASFLLSTFHLDVCDRCRDSEGVHSYITRTDAKTEFLLKDEDLDKREPILQFISRPNPHNPRWGDMKLYLRLQVEKRAMEVWGSLDKIELHRTIREENRVKTKIKKYNKKMSSLRMTARSSLFTRDLGGHVHDWEDEVYNEEEDNYTRTCKTCDQTETYEKM